MLIIPSLWNCEPHHSPNLTVGNTEKDKILLCAIIHCLVKEERSVKITLRPSTHQQSCSQKAEAGGLGRQGPSEQLISNGRLPNKSWVQLQVQVSPLPLSPLILLSPSSPLSLCCPTLPWLYLPATYIKSGIRSGTCTQPTDSNPIW